ncbi:DUF4150 domain-containing protein [Agrobacterium vitis]|uniref:DUF4150 domain-containing protein n=1 Tax=Agrobacterium vitis TaxID=373 RepID=UPI0018D2269A|nr:DUF4150 domain-containing protein [Agrobacterium vitis]MCM2440128.1 DUF4150 domain-containing protein [Agrobacterium vitis]
MSIPRDPYLGEPGYPEPWTTKQPREGLRDLDEARIVSLAPDVCWTPLGSSVVAIPYPIVDFCGHDQNYTPSVRFTGKKAMVMRSCTTHVHGDKPGVKKGVNSGTVESICEPVGHADQVRAEGSYVIRHLDRFKMNNGNTEGEAIFVRDTSTYDPPKDDDQVPGSLRWQDQPVQVAQAATGSMTDAGGGLFFAAGSTATTANGISRAPTQTLPRPSSIPKDLPTSMGKGLLRRLGVLGFLIEDALRDASLPASERDAEARSFQIVNSKAGQNAIINSKLLGGRTPVSLDSIADGSAWDFSGKYGLVIQAEERIPLANDILSSLAGRPVDLRTATAEEIQGILEGRDVARPQTYEESKKNADALAKANVRVAAESVSKGACLVGPHSVISKICPGESHHIVPDMALGWGDRAQRIAGQNRIKGAPSFQNGMAICLLKEWHTGLHQSLNKDLDAIGQQNVPTGTAPMIRIVRAATVSIDSIKELPEKCKEIAKSAAFAQMLPIMAKPGRTTVSLPSNDAIEVMRKGHY